MDNPRNAELHVPGRLCLFGEHTDWAGQYRSRRPELSTGLCITVGTDQGIRARAARVADRVRLGASATTLEVAPIDVPAAVEPLDRIARDAGWWSYAAGAAAEVRSRYPVGGLSLDVRSMTLPLRAGLSSSAAICVLVVRAFGALYDLGLDHRDEMELAYRGERRTPSRCGRMDQVCAFGSVPCALTLDGDSLEVEPIAPGGDLHLLVADLRGDKDTVRILRELNACYPETRGTVAEGVRRGLGPENLRLGRAAIDAIRSGDAPALGELMTLAQALFDRFVAPGCPSQLASPRLHRALSHPPLGELVWGGKGVGSQGDGSVQFLARGEAERTEARRVLERDLDLPCLEVTLRAG